jgi:hypothetical protein
VTSTSALDSGSNAATVRATQIDAIIHDEVCYKLLPTAAIELGLLSVKLVADLTKNPLHKWDNALCCSVI